MLFDQLELTSIVLSVVVNNFCSDGSTLKVGLVILSGTEIALSVSQIL